MVDGGRWVTVENIIRWEGMLKTERDEDKRRLLLDMIEKEQEKVRGQKQE